jgi:hypothetical protein
MSSSFSSPSLATAMTSAPCYLTVVRACYGPDRRSSPSDLTKKRATFGPLSRQRWMRGGSRSRIPHNSWRLRHFSRGAIPPRRRSTTIAPEHGRPKGPRTLAVLSFSDPTQASAAADRLACDRDRQENSRSAAQVPGKQWQTKGRGCAQLIVRLKAAPGTATIASRTRPDC